MTSIKDLGDTEDAYDITSDDGEVIEDTFTGRKLLF